MRRFAPGLIVLLLSLGAAPAQAEPTDEGAPQPVPPPPPVMVAPLAQTRAVVIHEPTSAEGDTFFPERASREFRGGSGEIQCHVSADNRLENCVVTAESPAGYGFGAAVVKLAALYRVKPPTRDGKYNENNTFRLTIQFHPPPMPDVVTLRPPGSPVAAPASGGYRGIDVAGVATPPSLARLARLQPKAAARDGVSGFGMLDCIVEVAGNLTDCRLIAEQPENYGFGQAALKASRYFVMHPAKVDGVPSMARKRVSVSFPAQELEFARLNPAESNAELVNEPRPVVPPSAIPRAPAIRSMAVLWIPALFALLLLAAAPAALWAPARKPRPRGLAY